MNSPHGHIFIVSHDAMLASELATHIDTKRFCIQQFQQLEEFAIAYTQEAPTVVIMDTAHTDDEAVYLQVLAKMQQDLDPPPPVIYISNHPDINARLAAASAGVSRYFVSPIDLNKISRNLAALTKQAKERTYRVLLIDDDEALVSLYGNILKKAGLEVKTLTNPLSALGALANFKPDLLFVDVHMPECSGPELARVIRQDSDLEHMPIIFLSSELDFEEQLTALEQGGDEFITKPVSSRDLITAAKTRIGRARSISLLNRNIEKALRESEFRRITLDQHAIVSITDVNGIVTFVNDKFCSISGYSQQELLGKNHRILKSGHHPDSFFEEMWDTISQGKVWHGTICNRCKDGSEYWVDSTIVPFLDASGLPYQYVSARTDITKLKQIEADLLSAKEAAETANTAKSQFLSSMSHELRTPLNAIIGFSQLLEFSELDSEQSGNVKEILRAGDHLLTLINEVLDLSSVESGHIDISMETVAFGEVIVECLSLITPLAQQNNISINILQAGVETSTEQALQSDTHVQADRIRLKQALINLLNNAIKYNSVNGSITISTKTTLNNWLRISIIDTGPGIASEKQSQLFTAFNRLGAEQTEIEGTGIGLAYTKEIIELMGGKIGVDSALGKGSTFWIELPGDILSSSVVDAEKENKEHLQAQTTLEHEHQHTVLYVEDNPANLRFVTQLIAQHRNNINLLAVSDPRQGLALAEEKSPDLIMLDINLPGMDGFEMLKILRDNETTANIPVIAISARAMPQDIERGLAAGFKRYVSKPIDVKQFLSVIENMLA